jgi:two-component system, chemotaxis family, response regulator Rcp1
MSERTVRILIAEDNAGDVFLIRRALDRHGLKHHLTIAKNGEEALRLLQEAQTSPSDAAPELILLDLNLPRVDGAQVLSHIRRTKAFAGIPVIVLTSSDSARDRDLALSQGANGYFRKPTDLQSFMELGRVIEETLNRAE